ncbi:MAG: hypothetical protein R2706_19725 [Acidimicrobiales bacterium]
MELRVSARVGMHDGLAGTLVPQDEISAPPVEARLTYQSIESRRRGSMVVPIGELVNPALTMQRSEWAGEVTFRAELLRTSGRPRVAGFGADRGSILATSSAQRVLLAPPIQPPGNSVTVRWENFKESPDSWRRSHASHLFSIDATSIPTPVVYLNVSFPDAAILNGTGTTGWKARTRDATNAMIAHQTWSTLIAIALAEFRDTKDGDDDDRTARERLDDVGDFNRAVLVDWGSYLYPDESDEEAILTALMHSVDDRAITTIDLGHVANAVQERVGTLRGFEGLVREMNR